MKNRSLLPKSILLTFLFTLITLTTFAQKRLRLVIAGLNHDHVHGILSQYHKGLVDIVGIAEPNTELWKKYGKLYSVPDSLFFPDLKKLVMVKKPDAVLGYNAAAGHLDIVKICAPLGISVMVEKPLAATLTQAKQIEALAMQYHIKVLTNYETTWYASYHDVYNTVGNDVIGPVK